MKALANSFANRNFKKSVLSGIAIVVACLSTILLFKTLYFVSEDMKGVEILSNQNEAFVKVEMHRSVVVGSFLGILSRRILAFVTFPADHFREDLLLWHIKNGRVERYEFKKFKPAGSMFPYRGSMYYSIGVENPSDWPAVWRWAGSSFEKVDKAKAESIMTSFKLYDEIIAQEGWRSERPYFTTNGTTILLQFSTNQFSFVLKETNMNGSRERSLTLQSQNGTEAETLVRTTGAYQSIQRQTYLDFYK